MESNKLFDAQMNEWKQELVCIARELPVEQGVEGLPFRETVVAHTHLSTTTASPWPIKDAARFLVPKEALTAEQLMHAEQETAQLLASHLAM